MNKEQIIDEIDWLISEIKPGTLAHKEQIDALIKLGVDHKQRSSSVIEDLKAKRETLL